MDHARGGPARPDQRSPLNSRSQRGWRCLSLVTTVTRCCVACSATITGPLVWPGLACLPDAAVGLAACVGGSDPLYGLGGLGAAAFPYRQS
jgi:hypothetical protein